MSWILHACKILKLGTHVVYPSAKVQLSHGIYFEAFVTLLSMEAWREMHLAFGAFSLVSCVWGSDGVLSSSRDPFLWVPNVSGLIPFLKAAGLGCK